MSFIKSKKEIEILAEGGKRLAEILQKVADTVEPGITTQSLNELAEGLIVSSGGVPAFKGYRIPGVSSRFPAVLCTSVNDEIVHGIPSDRVLQEGDIIGLDIGMKYQGLFTDTAVSVGVGVIGDKSQNLLSVTKQALMIGCAAVRPGIYTGDIGEAIQTYVEDNGYGVVRELVGHGVGHAVHEDPQIPNFGKRNHGIRIHENMVLALEPMVTAGAYRVALADDGWTWRTHDGSRAAHFEHTLAVTKNGARILTEA